MHAAGPARASVRAPKHQGPGPDPIKKEEKPGLELSKFGCANCCGDQVAEIVDRDEENALDVFMRAIANNPRFVPAKRSGEAFVITGARPPTRK
jgi:hypothetical protein